MPKRLDELGALVEPEPLGAYDLPLRERTGAGVESGILVPSHLVTFGDGLTLRFEFTLYELRGLDDQIEDFDLDTYSFGLRQPNGTWIWRYDKHHRIHHDFDRREHVHVGPDEIPDRSHEVDLDYVLHLIETERDSGLYESFSV